MISDSCIEGIYKRQEMLTDNQEYLSKIRDA